jgi:hypothetical protein
MKKIVLVVIALLMPMFALAEGPVIKYRYSPVFDGWCTATNGTEVPDSKRQQLLGKVDNFQAEWDKLGPKLLATTEDLIGKPFRRREVTATLFLCGRTPSMSMPLLVNGNWFVDGEKQIPNDMATHIVFHELLHIYLVDNFMHESLLRKKYEAEGENFIVLNHMHLMAIQKLVYLELGLEDELSRVIANDSILTKGAYRRSWEIVNEVGHEIFVAELQ